MEGFITTVMEEVLGQRGFFAHAKANIYQQPDKSLQRAMFFAVIYPLLFKMVRVPEPSARLPCYCVRHWLAPPLPPAPVSLCASPRALRRPRHVVGRKLRAATALAPMVCV